MRNLFSSGAALAEVLSVCLLRYTKASFTRRSYRGELMSRLRVPSHHLNHHLVQISGVILLSTVDRTQLKPIAVHPPAVIMHFIPNAQTGRMLRTRTYKLSCREVGGGLKDREKIHEFVGKRGRPRGISSRVSPGHKR